MYSGMYQPLDSNYFLQMKGQSYGHCTVESAWRIFLPHLMTSVGKVLCDARAKTAPVPAVGLGSCCLTPRGLYYVVFGLWSQTS